MACRCINGLLILLILGFARGTWACQEPPHGIHFARENLDDDIVMTMVSQGPDDTSLWIVKGLTSGQPRLSHTLAKSFAMSYKKPFWNLVVTSGIAIPKSEMPSVTFNITLDIECRENHNNELKSFVYAVTVSVFPESYIEKIQITVAENTPVNSFIYHDKQTLSATPAKYTHYPSQGTNDASNFLKLSAVTGSVTLVRALDYEHDPKVMWFLTTKEVNFHKIRLFRIEIGNINDNSPDFYLNENCHMGPACRMTHYSFTLDKQGELIADNGNHIHAVDGDGDVITYSIVEARPEQTFMTIDERSGELKAQRPTSDHASRYLLIVQASDGFHKASTSVTVEVEEGKMVDNVLAQMGVTGAKQEAGNKAQQQQPPPSLNIMSFFPPIRNDYVKENKMLKPKAMPVPKLSKVFNHPYDKTFSQLTPNQISKVANRFGHPSGTIVNNNEDQLFKISNHQLAKSPSQLPIKNPSNGHADNMINDMDLAIAGFNETINHGGNGSDVNMTLGLNFTDSYLLELCANVTLILVDGEEEEEREEGKEEEKEKEGEDGKEEEEGEKEKEGEEEGKEEEGKKEEEDIHVLLVRRNGTEMGLEEAKQVCEDSMKMETVVADADKKEEEKGSSASSRIVNNMVVLVTSFLWVWLSSAIVAY